MTIEQRIAALEEQLRVAERQYFGLQGAVQVAKQIQADQDGSATAGPQGTPLPHGK